MPRNGSGSYSRAVTPPVNGDVADADLFNSEMNDMATALTNSLARNGEATPTANLPMNGFKHTGLGKATAATDSLRADQGIGAVGGAYYDTTGSSNAYVVTTTAALTAYAAGQTFLIKASFTNTGAATLNVDGIGAKNLFLNGAALRGGELLSGQIYTVSYDGTQFLVLSAQSVISSYITRNRVANPCGFWNQRAAATNADDTYASDRWNILTQSNPVAITNLTNPETGVQTGIRMTQSNATPQRMGFSQIFETGNIRDLRSAICSFLARVRLSTTANLRYAVLEWTGTADSVTSDVVNDWTSSNYTTGNFFISTTTNLITTASLSCTAATVADLQALGFTLGASMNNVIVFVWTEATVAQNVTLDWWNADFYKGSAARIFEPPNPDFDFSYCTRFFYLGSSNDFYVTQDVTNATGYSHISKFPRRMRIAPGVTLTDNMTGFGASSVAATTNDSVRVSATASATAAGRIFSAIVRVDAEL